MKACHVDLNCSTVGKTLFLYLSHTIGVSLTPKQELCECHKVELHTYWCFVTGDNVFSVHGVIGVTHGKEKGVRQIYGNVAKLVLFHFKFWNAWIQVKIN